MKKVFVASLFLALGSLAQAAFIQCSPAEDDIVLLSAIVPGGAVFKCDPGTGGAGTGDDNVAGDSLLVTGIKLGLSGSFSQSGGTIGTTYGVTFNTTNDLGFPNDPGNPSCSASAVNSGTLPTTEGNCISIVPLVGFHGIIPVDVVGSFMVTVTGAVNGALPLPRSASASVYYQVETEEKEPPPPGVPEPSTYAMMAAGLVGFYMVRRRS